MGWEAAAKASCGDRPGLRRGIGTVLLSESDVAIPGMAVAQVPVDTLCNFRGLRQEPVLPSNGCI
ncbi:hypothetical protein EFR01_57280 [Sinorhizobium fredii]|nr:hypothetical protein EFR01_57280 [Sinorhizobium fredii]GLS07202.1 hypothetical protein GCM10007864_08280 [Sinorhizobium fredii]